MFTKKAADAYRYQKRKWIEASVQQELARASNEGKEMNLFEILINIYIDYKNVFWLFAQINVLAKKQPQKKEKTEHTIRQLLRQMRMACLKHHNSRLVMVRVNVFGVLLSFKATLKPYKAI